jgi:hypothetical protein
VQAVSRGIGEMIAAVVWLAGMSGAQPFITYITD